MSERKSIVEVVLMPVVVVIVSALFSFQLGSVQIKQQEIRAESDRELKCIELFWSDAMSGNERRCRAALKMVEEIQPELRQPLTNALASFSTQEETLTELVAGPQIVARQQKSNAKCEELDLTRVKLRKDNTLSEYEAAIDIGPFEKCKEIMLIASATCRVHDNNTSTVGVKLFDPSHAIISFKKVMAQSQPVVDTQVVSIPANKILRFRANAFNENATVETCRLEVYY
jgi:hypothetical protein